MRNIYLTILILVSTCLLFGQAAEEALPLQQAVSDSLTWYAKRRFFRIRLQGQQPTFGSGGKAGDTESR
jgi:hypothetical protein